MGQKLHNELYTEYENMEVIEGSFSRFKEMTRKNQTKDKFKKGKKKIRFSKYNSSFFQIFIFVAHWVS